MKWLAHRSGTLQTYFTEFLLINKLLLQMIVLKAFS